MNIREMGEKDFQQVIELSNLEHWNYGPGDLARFIAMEPKGCIVAEADNIIGMAFCFAFGHIGSIGGIIIHPDHRGKGIGSALLDHCVSYLKERTESIILYSYESAVSFYETRKFVQEGAVLSFSGIPARTGADVGKELVKDDLVWLFPFDWERFGGHRDRLLAQLMKEKPAWCARTKEGYGMAKGTPDDIVEIGPVVSDDNTTLDALLSRLPKTTIEISIPENNITAVQRVEQLGLSRSGRRVRMCLGNPSTLHRSVWAIGGLETG